MVARVSIYDIPDDRADDAVDAFREALGTIAASRGLAEGLFLVSRDGSRGVAMTVWEDEGAMSASRVAASRLRGEAIRSVEGATVMVDEYEIAVRVGGTA